MTLPNRILIVRIFQQNQTGQEQDRWYFRHLPELSRFFKYWIKEKFNHSVDFYYTTFHASNMALVDGRVFDLVIDNNKGFDFHVFITDNYPPSDRADGLYGLTWFVVRHTEGPSWSPMTTTALRMSHEFLHAILDKMGLPKKVWYDGVHDYIGKYEYWRPRFFLLRWGGFNYKPLTTMENVQGKIVTQEGPPFVKKEE